MTVERYQTPEVDAAIGSGSAFDPATMADQTFIDSGTTTHRVATALKVQVGDTTDSHTFEDKWVTINAGGYPGRIGGYYTGEGAYASTFAIHVGAAAPGPLNFSFALSDINTIFNTPSAAGILYHSIGGYAAMTVQQWAAFATKFDYYDVVASGALGMTAYVDSAGEVAFVGAPTITHLSTRMERPTTDVAAPVIVLKGAQATSFATAVAANKIGGPLAFRPGDPQTVGTDAPGPIYFGVGDPVSTTVPSGVIIGYGPEVGSGRSYVPFTTELVRITYVLDECKVRTNNKALRLSSVGNMVAEVDAGSISLAVAAATKFQATTTTTTVSNSTLVQVQCTAGPAHLIASNLNVCSMNGGNVTNRCATDFTIENFDASFQYEKWTFASNLQTSKWNVSGYAAQKERRYFYGTSTTSGTTVLTGSFTPTANRTIRVEAVTIGYRDDGSAGFSKTSLGTFRVNGAGTVTAITTNTTVGEHDDSTGTGAASAIDTSGGQIRVTVSGLPSENWRWEAYVNVYYGSV